MSLLSQSRQIFNENFCQNLDVNVRTHLFKVYTCMTLTCAAATAGSLVHLTGLWEAGLLSILLQLIATVALVLTPNRKSNVEYRFGLLMIVGALAGHLLGLLIEQAMIVNPAFVLTALLGTTLSFTWLSLAALLAERGSHLILGGILSSALTILVLVGLANLFFQSWLLHKWSLYAGLAVMCGFVLFDTQLIVEDVRQGSDDYVSHALRLFFSIVDIFRFLMAIMISTERNNQRRRRDSENE
ncbi:bax inhibitor 1-like [Topomyia yanbarensis]|uniref:bax inhibitor 1-like n=1 Tax=Topomyia yanbarensis TaxID=2498891 RepID=UPI00273B3BC4|nr:bax inhibitor 1-like [Topomyia yanbarensis]